MTRDELLLVQVMEECDELSQRVSKALRFGLEQVQPGQELNNRDRIYQEYYDLRAVLGMAGIDAWDTSSRAEVAEYDKVQKVEKYLAFSLGLAEHP